MRSNYIFQKDETSPLRFTSVEVTRYKAYRLGSKSSLTLAQDATAGSLCRRCAPYERSGKV